MLQQKKSFAKQPARMDTVKPNGQPPEKARNPARRMNGGMRSSHV
jgi:hypothetical protein